MYRCIELMFMSQTIKMFWFYSSYSISALQNSTWQLIREGSYLIKRNTGLLPKSHKQLT